MLKFALHRKPLVTPRTWHTLDELREAAFASGYSPAQFERAIKLIGDHADAVTMAYFLKFNAFVPSGFAI